MAKQDWLGGLDWPLDSVVGRYFNTQFIALVSPIVGHYVRATTILCTAAASTTVLLSVPFAGANPPCLYMHRVQSSNTFARPLRTGRNFAALWPFISTPAAHRPRRPLPALGVLLHSASHELPDSARQNWLSRAQLLARKHPSKKEGAAAFSGWPSLGLTTVLMLAVASLARSHPHSHSR